MQVDKPVVNFESANLTQKLTDEIKKSLTPKILQEIQESPYAYSFAYEELIKNLYISILHSMICDTDIIANRIRFCIVDIPLIEPIILVEDESKQILHVLSRTLVRRIFYYKCNSKVIDDNNDSTKNVEINETKKLKFSPTTMLKLKDSTIHPELSEDAIYLSGLVLNKILLCYVIAEHAVTHYYLFMINREKPKKSLEDAEHNPDYVHQHFDELPDRNMSTVFLSQLMTREENRMIHKYLE